MKTGAIMLFSMLSLSGCAAVPTVECPAIPELTARVPLGQSFQVEMQQLLQGSLPELTDSDRGSEPATPTSIR